MKDDKGKTLPKTAVSGQISWWTVETASGPGTGRLLQSNRASGEARSFACGCPYRLCGDTFTSDYSLILEGVLGAPLDGLGSIICIYQTGSNCGYKQTMQTSSQALSYRWSSSNSAILQINGSSASSSVNVTGAGIGTASMTGTVSATYFGPPGTCTFQGSGPTTVQVPTSLQFISVSVLPDGTFGVHGCPGSAWSGIKVDIKYQVLDQQSPAQPIQSSNMTPHEKGTHFDGSSYDNNIGPVSGYPTSSATTASDGTFHDVPLGVCLSSTFSSLTATQNITMIVGSDSYAVRSQNWTATGTTAGHGTIKNSITSPGTGSDVSASR